MVWVSVYNPQNTIPTQMISGFSAIESWLFLAAVAEAIIPHSSDFPSALELNVPEAIDRLLKLAHPAVQEEITLLLALLENATANALLHFSPVPFSQMSLKDRTSILTKWATSGLSVQRKGYKALNGLCQSAYYAQSQSHALIGYDGPPEHLLQLVQSVARKGVQPQCRFYTANTIPTRVTDIDCDVCIIGSGAGGATLAARLSAAGKDVVMLESGHYDTQVDFNMDEGVAFQRRYQEQGLRSSEDLAITVLQGSGVGGSTTINWTSCFRTPERILDIWSDRFGIQTLTRDTLDPIF